MFIWLSLCVYVSVSQFLLFIQRPGGLKNKHAETKNTITEVKNTLEGINSRLSEAERISELEDKMVEITSEEQNIVKRMKRTEDNLRDLWDSIRSGILC